MQHFLLTFEKIAQRVVVSLIDEVVLMEESHAVRDLIWSQKEKWRERRGRKKQTKKKRTQNEAALYIRTVVEPKTH